MHQKSLAETFKQAHLNNLWGLEDFHHNPADPNKYNLWQLNSFATNLPYPLVYVAISKAGDCLQLSYFIEKKPWLHLENFQPNQFDRRDYLWEDNCLECFVELSNDMVYLEANVSPDGSYNLYRFDAYRTPDTMPPFEDKLAMLLPQVTQSEALDNWYQYHWTIKLAEYRPFYTHERGKDCTISKINLCVILYQDIDGEKQPIYYAVKHANPPDFHNKDYWLTF